MDELNDVCAKISDIVKTDIQQISASMAQAASVLQAMSNVSVVQNAAAVVPQASQSSASIMLPVVMPNQQQYPQQQLQQQQQLSLST
jgi:hypothetical protein